MEGSGQDNGRKDPTARRRKTLLGIPGPAELSALSPPIDYEPDQSDRPSGASPVAPSPGAASPVRLPNEQAVVLLVGTGHPMQEALWAALKRHEILSKTATPSSAPISIGGSAPTVVLVLGDGSVGGGKAVVESLRSAGLSESVPIVVLLDDTTLESRLEALRAGAAAAIPQSASVDQIARRVSDLARAGDVSRVRGEVVGETTLSDLLNLVGDELKGRLLPAGTPKVDSRNVRLMLGAGPPLLRSLDAFYEGLGQAVLESHRADDDLAHVADSEDDGPDAPPSVKKSIRGVRLVLADDDSARADQVADELRRRGATVVVTGLSPREERMVRLRQSDPMVLLVRSEDRAAGQALLDAMKGDMRLRWVTLVVTDWDERNGPGKSGQPLDALVEQIAATGEADRRLSQAAETGGEVDVKLQDLGPARALRAVSASTRPLRFVVDNPRVQIAVELSDGIVTGAVATESDDWAPIGEGPAALKALLSLATGKLSIAPVTGPRTLNVMNTVAAALDLAENERSPIAASIPPPSLVTSSVADLASPESPPNPARNRLLVGGAALAVAFAFAVGFGAARVASKPAPALAQPTPVAAVRASAARAEAPAEVVDSPAPATKPPAKKSYLELAQEGDSEGTKLILDKPVSERTVAETLALAQGAVARERQELALLTASSVAHPEQLEDKKTATRFAELARDETVAQDVLAALATIPSPRAADLVYDVWAGTKDRTPVTDMAKDLLAGPLKKQASPALSIALDLRNAATCEEVQALLPRAVDDADRRSLRVLGHLVGVRKCGPAKNQDCYPCLRKSTLVPKAVRAARSRVPPTP